ncbi:hypothetical protein SKAU_G00241120 [Synaphobranchus kaupii]|uniref:Uncharacterized protein n=1 Tax=Synaphobranchus kaupii TaxID=118154 RepID=A0A9Q1F7K5_SYNKA|nr:hypothetical protein SKAU_G00241120 [Synaphobranchus kaupii]
MGRWALQTWFSWSHVKWSTIQPISYPSKTPQFGVGVLVSDGIQVAVVQAEPPRPFLIYNKDHRGGPWSRTLITPLSSIPFSRDHSSRGSAAPHRSDPGSVRGQRGIRSPGGAAKLLPAVNTNPMQHLGTGRHLYIITPPQPHHTQRCGGGPQQRPAPTLAGPFPAEWQKKPWPPGCTPHITSSEQQSSCRIYTCTSFFRLSNSYDSNSGARATGSLDACKRETACRTPPPETPDPAGGLPGTPPGR